MLSRIHKEQLQMTMQPVKHCTCQHWQQYFYWLANISQNNTTNLFLLGSISQSHSCSKASYIVWCICLQLLWDQNKACGGILCTSVFGLCFAHGAARFLCPQTHSSNSWHGKPHNALNTHFSQNTIDQSESGLFPIQHRCSNTKNKRQRQQSLFQISQ